MTVVGGSTTAQTKLERTPGFFYLGLAGGIDIPGQGWQTAYTLSPGGMACLGFEFDKDLSLQLDMEGFTFSGVNFSGTISDTELFLIPTVRYHFGGPYLLAGAGGEFELLSGNPGAPVADFDVVLGAGFEADLGDRAFFFVEGKYNFIFSSQVVGQDIPVLAGCRLGL